MSKGKLSCLKLIDDSIIILKGKMSKEQFLEKSKELMGDQASLMGEALFRVFDEDNR